MLKEGEIALVDRALVDRACQLEKGLKTCKIVRDLMVMHRPFSNKETSSAIALTLVNQMFRKQGDFEIDGFYVKKVEELNNRWLVYITNVEPGSRVRGGISFKVEVSKKDGAIQSMVGY